MNNILDVKYWRIVQHPWSSVLRKCPIPFILRLDQETRGMSLRQYTTYAIRVFNICAKLAGMTCIPLLTSNARSYNLITVGAQICICKTKVNNAQVYNRIKFLNIKTLT